MIFLLSCLLLVSATQASIPVFLEDAADKITAGFKKRGSRLYVDILVVEWQPASLVMNMGDIDLTQPLIEIKSGSGDWIKPDVPPTPRRGKYRMTFAVTPCHNHRLRFTVKNLQGEEAIFELPNGVGPASEEEILASRFTPKAPTNIRVEESNDRKILVSWDESECATSYDVFASGGKIIKGKTQGTSIELEDADSCVNYEIAVMALTGEQASEETLVDYTTLPRHGDAKSLSIEIVPDVRSVMVFWDGWTSLSCVEDYSVNVCQGDICTDPKIVARNKFGGKSIYSPGVDLEECSEYSVHMRPLYNGLAMVTIVNSFHTLVPEMKNIEKELGKVNAQPQEEQEVKLDWSPIKCASNYSVYRKLWTGGNSWKEIETVKTPFTSIKAVPCTQYIYGVRAILGPQFSEIVGTDSPVEVPLDDKGPYQPLGLLTIPSETGILLTWDHSLCISSYKVKICKNDCQDFIVEVSNQHTVSQTFSSLMPCTEYKVTLIAISKEGHEMKSEPLLLSTVSPLPSPPSDISVSLTSHRLDVKFQPVTCASSYRIYQRLDDGEQILLKNVSMTETSIELPEPCSAYSLVVSSLVDGVESLKSYSVDGKTSSSHVAVPNLDIVKIGNGTIQFVVKAPTVNRKCEVESYEVKYKSMFSSLKPTKDGILTLNEVQESEDKGILEARIKYMDGIFSPWVSPKHMVASLTEEEANSMVVPVSVGTLVAVVFLVIVLSFIINRKKSDKQMDASSAEDRRRLNP